MAQMTARALRLAARAAIESAGGRGFLRVCMEGDALLVSDAPRRAPERADAMLLALAQAGFRAETVDGLLYIAPTRQGLSSIDGGRTRCAIDWASARAPAQALADRLLRKEKTPLTAEGERLVLETMRLLWQPEASVLRGLPALRSLCAAQLRRRDESGMREAGLLLAAWADETDHLSHKEVFP